MDIRVLDPSLALPDLIAEDGLLKLLPSSAYDDIPPDNLRLWCHHHGRYGLPTVELVDWLRSFIGSRKAIEIGSGAGDLAWHLRVRGTDNKQQEWPDVKRLYASMGQPVIRYPDWVKEIDALEAVRQYSPQIVIGSWITQWVDPSKPMPPEGGNMYGVKEDLLLAENVTYVLIGNEKIHGGKRIMTRGHEILPFPWLRSRATFQELNRIYIWHGRE
jgi:hypothetical protein